MTSADINNIRNVEFARLSEEMATGSLATGALEAATRSVPAKHALDGSTQSRSRCRHTHARLTL